MACRVSSQDPEVSFYLTKGPWTVVRIIEKTLDDIVPLQKIPPGGFRIIAHKVFTGMAYYTSDPIKSSNVILLIFVAGGLDLTNDIAAKFGRLEAVVWPLEWSAFQDR